jgi:uncharacterized membrane protein
VLAAAVVVRGRLVRNQTAQAPVEQGVLELQIALLVLLLHTQVVAVAELMVVRLMEERAVLAVVVLAAELW